MKLFTKFCLAIFFGAVFVAKGQESSGNIINLNPSFEEENKGWIIDKDRDLDISKISPLAAHTGKLGLRLEDDNDSGGAQVESNWYNVLPNKKYKVSFYGRVHSGCGFAVLLIFADAQGRWLTIPERGIAKLTVNPDAKEWKKFELISTSPEGTARAQIRINTWDKGKTLSDMDDVELSVVN